MIFFEYVNHHSRAPVPRYSLLMLAYTNRFLTLATIIRTLYDHYHTSRDENLAGQIANLRYRIRLIRSMQIYGVLSLIFCVISMIALFAGWYTAGQSSFTIAMLQKLISLALSLRELQVSGGALDLLLKDMEEHKSQGKVSFWS